MAYTPKNFDQIVGDIVSYIVSTSSQISDINPGSVLRSIVEGVSLSIEEIHVSSYLGFRRYLQTIAPDIFEFQRKSGTTAKAAVVFSRAGTVGTVLIPVGTEVQTASGLSFFTTVASQIPNASSSSASVAVEAELAGTAHNVTAATITVIADDLDGVETVTNALAAVGGVDRESDFEYNKRFQSYIEGLGKSNIAGIVSGALSIEGITSASVVEHFPPEVVAGDPDVNVSLYVDDGSLVGVNAGLIATVQDTIDGDGTEESPGYRAAGVKVKVVAPTIVTVTVTLNISPLLGVDLSQVESDVNLALTNYINTQPIGTGILLSEIFGAVMGVFGVRNMTIVSPATDVAVSAGQVGRLGVLTLNFV